MGRKAPPKLRPKGPTIQKKKNNPKVLPYNEQPKRNKTGLGKKTKTALNTELVETERPGSVAEQGQQVMRVLNFMKDGIISDLPN